MKELDPATFGTDLDALIDVYAAAMNVSDMQLPGRRAIMEAHAVNPAFRAIAVTAPPGDGRGSEGRGSQGPGSDGRGSEGRGCQGRGSEGGAIIAFGYGFHGDSGQWWHDLVRWAVFARSGPAIATAWLDDSFEVAELHVRPEYQQRGIGRRLLLRLTDGLTERTAVLSTMDADSPARRLYRSLGFSDLLTNYRFAAATDAYAVMGAALPLLNDRPPSPRYW
jgi:GNAT superfamily N-acetyltransferase